ncbi:MAG: DUF4163 domain-containing protein [Lachnospiraceae bacterium]|nr:DUF4163 domain-containing protein [Lachnospiraceae bacterium]
MNKKMNEKMDRRINRRIDGKMGRKTAAAIAVACICIGGLQACFWGENTVKAEEYFSGIFQASVSTVTQGDYVKIEYPVLAGIDGFDQSIVDSINQHFYEEAYKMAMDEAENMNGIAAEVQEYNPDSVQHLTSEVTCGSIYIDGEIFSVEQDYYSYTGGAHGYGFPVGTTFNLRTGEELTMGGILGCDETTAQEAVVEAYRKEIIGQVENITEDSIRSCFDIMKYWVQAEGMYVNIAPYNVASYAAGQQTALVTPEILSAVSGGASGSTDNGISGGSLDASGAGNGAALEGSGGALEAPVEMITVVNGIQAPASDFIFPYSSTQTLTDADLTKLEGSSVEEEHYKSQLAINEILARYGYVFHPENGGASKEAYDQFNGKDWYEQAKPYCPSSSANDMLYTYITSTELNNIDIICEWQKVHNCYY